MKLFMDMLFSPHPLLAFTLVILTTITLLDEWGVIDLLVEWWLL